MGGDFAPQSEVIGALSVLNEDRDNSISIIFVGDEQKIKKVISEANPKNQNFSIVHADEVVTMEDVSTSAIKKKKNSSLYVGLELQSQGKSDAFISVGNTGAMLSTSTILLGRIKGVSRPTIGSFFPSVGENPVLVVDVGANIDCKPRFLYEFAVMGSIYFSQILGIEKPRVGLLNIGEEDSKGTEVVKETFKMLKGSNLNFIGNVEGRDILGGNADVVVCDGFTGNIILKFAESVFPFIKTKFKAFADKGIMNKVVMGIAKPSMKKVFSDFDYQKYGGIPILGVNGVSMVGHGKSSPEAIRNIIYKSIEIVSKNVNKRIEEALNQPIVNEELS
jgi:phosphate acyltransferase